MANSSDSGYRLEYTVQDNEAAHPVRSVEVQASEEEVAQLEREGFLVRERFFEGETLESLRAALDRLEAQARAAMQPHDSISANRQFGGLFIRYLMDKDPVFLNMIAFQPFLSLARALLGPQLQTAHSARITYPNEPNQETMWHQHLRYVPKPLPPWFIRPHGLDVLIYLDDVTEENGPLCIVPGTHHQLDREPPGEYYGDLPGQIKLRPPAGTAVFLHANLWHRGMPNTENGAKRRLLLFNYCPTWLKRGVYGVRPADGLTRPLIEQGDPEMLELLGIKGYM